MSTEREDDPQQMLEDWDQHIYDLVAAGVSLDDIEDAVRVTVEAIREERGDD